LPPLEAPELWGKQYKETFSQLAQTPEQRAAAEAWLNQYKESQGYITKKEQEYADYRKRLDPIYETIRPYEGYWAQQGMSPETGVRQLLSYAEALARDPASVIPQLAQMYGVDLQSLIAEQPYVDPQVQALQQQLQQVQGQFYQQHQQAQQQQYHRLTEEIRAFETAVDEQGNPKAPHFTRVWDSMLRLANGGLAKNIQEAYEKAVALDHDLQAEIAADRAKKEAATRAAEAKKALDASRGVKSKGTEGAPPVRSAREEFAAQLAAQAN